MPAEATWKRKQRIDKEEGKCEDEIVTGGSEVLTGGW